MNNPCSSPIIARAPHIPPVPLGRGGSPVCTGHKDMSVALQRRLNLDPERDLFGIVAATATTSGDAECGVGAGHSLILMVESGPKTDGAMVAMDAGDDAAAAQGGGVFRFSLHVLPTSWVDGDGGVGGGGGGGGGDSLGPWMWLDYESSTMMGHDELTCRARPSEAGHHVFVSWAPEAALVSPYVEGRWEGVGRASGGQWRGDDTFESWR